ncbi:uncharacterized protein ASCRUDRAFT_80422 [Ascoidea rubescens DSM 1968]|uniref:Uncharacterized protein n=1 Tax=Ascoidea rubescens DSM 1968 TaxID=1344418 RepID=A0A1D2VKJ7_9ASCO|nr:hypothetical protein ASCRUDRAFT_80422 [Ascoidea rubescens DSM 1968]ODV62126.1 hypothetical protein ASCRUDRAFT_80422 [Ascoidea rubescens DSM 1968]
MSDPSLASSEKIQKIHQNPTSQPPIRHTHFKKQSHINQSLPSSGIPSIDGSSIATSSTSRLSRPLLGNRSSSPSHTTAAAKSTNSPEPKNNISTLAQNHKNPVSPAPKINSIFYTKSSLDFNFSFNNIPNPPPPKTTLKKSNSITTSSFYLRNVKTKNKYSHYKSRSSLSIVYTPDSNALSAAQSIASSQSHHPKTPNNPKDKRSSNPLQRVNMNIETKKLLERTNKYSFLSTNKNTLASSNTKNFEFSSKNQKPPSTAPIEYAFTGACAASKNVKDLNKYDRNQNYDLSKYDTKILDQAKILADNTIKNIESSKINLFGNSKLNSHAILVAQENARLRNINSNSGTIDVGGGLLVSVDDINDVARRNVNPVLQEINRKADEQRRLDLKIIEEERLKKQEKERYKKEQTEREHNQRRQESLLKLERKKQIQNQKEEDKSKITNLYETKAAELSRQHAILFNLQKKEEDLLKRLKEEKEITLKGYETVESELKMQKQIELLEFKNSLDFKKSSFSTLTGSPDPKGNVGVFIEDW